MTNCIDQLSSDLLNKLGFFSKIYKNIIIFMISETFIFRTNYIISKNAIYLFYTSLI